MINPKCLGVSTGTEREDSDERPLFEIPWEQYVPRVTLGLGPTSARVKSVSAFFFFPI